MSGNEQLVLDARVLDVVSKRAFVAELVNGHRFTAFGTEKDAPECEALSPGRRVQVSFSPFDMTKARILFSAEAGAEKDHESA